jgi:preprotein translocase subunit SecG
VITFLLVVHTLIAIGLVGVILLQRSEGGGLGIGGGTGGGLMSARGAANLLTRSTTVLATLFIASSIVLAVLAAGTNKAKPIDTSLAAPVSKAAGAPIAAPGGVPLVPGALPGAPAPASTPASAPAPAPESGVPLAR